MSLPLPLRSSLRVSGSRPLESGSPLRDGFEKATRPPFLSPALYVRRCTDCRRCTPPVYAEYLLCADVNRVPKCLGAEVSTISHVSAALSNDKYTFHTCTCVRGYRPCLEVQTASGMETHQEPAAPATTWPTRAASLSDRRG